MDEQTIDEIKAEIFTDAKIGAAFFRSAALYAKELDEKGEVELPEILARCVNHAVSVATGDVSQLVELVEMGAGLPKELSDLLLIKGLTDLQEEITKTVVMSIVGTYFYLNDPKLAPTDEQAVEIVKKAMKEQE